MKAFDAGEPQARRQDLQGQRHPQAGHQQRGRQEDHQDHPRRGPQGRQGPDPGRRDPRLLQEARRSAGRPAHAQEGRPRRRAAVRQLPLTREAIGQAPSAVLAPNPPSDRDMAPAQREPKVVVLGGGSWGTTVASICARRGPTLQWVRSEETAKDINENHRNSKYLGDEVELSPTLQATTDFSEAADCRRRDRDGCAVARVPRRAEGTGQGAAAMGAGGVVGQGSRAGHQLADEPDRRRGAARPSGGHPGRAEHRARGGRGVRRRRGAGDARPASGGQPREIVPHQAISDVHHRRRRWRGDGGRVEERLRDRGRDGLFTGHRREHPRDGDRPRRARDVEARRGDGRAPRHVRRAWPAWAT